QADRRKRWNDRGTGVDDRRRRGTQSCERSETARTRNHGDLTCNTSANADPVQARARIVESVIHACENIRTICRNAGNGKRARKARKQLTARGQMVAIETGNGAASTRRDVATRCEQSTRLRIESYRTKRPRCGLVCRKSKSSDAGSNR